MRSLKPTIFSAVLFYNAISQYLSQLTVKWNTHHKSVVVQSLSQVWLSVTPWTAACQASPSFTISWSLLKLMSIESVMPSISSSVVPFSSCLQSFPASGSFPMNWLFTSGGQSTGASYDQVKLGKPVFTSLVCMKTFKIKSYQYILLGNEDFIENNRQRWYYQDHILSVFYRNHSTTKRVK